MKEIELPKITVEIFLFLRVKKVFLLKLRV